MAATTVLSLPGGLKWNTKEIPENARKHQFTRVRKGHKKVSYVSLSGAPQMWKKALPEYNTTIYILRVPSSVLNPGSTAGGEMDLRIAGTPEDVNYALMAVVGGNQTLVNSIMQYAITSANYQTVAKATFDQEVAAREAYKQTQGEHKVKHLSLEMIKFFGSSGNVKQAVVSQGSSAHPGFGPRRSQDIRAKLVSILPGGSEYNANDLKSIDVSTMDLGTGHGAKKAKRPSPNGTSKKIHSDMFPGIMSNDFEHFYAAVKMLYPQQTESPQGQQMLSQLAQFWQGRVQQQITTLGATGRISVPSAWGVSPAVQSGFPAQQSGFPAQQSGFPAQQSGAPSYQQTFAAPGVPVTLPGATTFGIPQLVNQ